jgi:amino acid transporter
MIGFIAMISKLGQYLRTEFRARRLRSEVAYRPMEIGKHGLNRELKLWDLVPMQIAVIVWLGWAGFAAKQGRTQVMLWLLAIVFFYLPLAAVVMKLSRSMPVEGGVYQWVKEGISPFAGYMAAWNFTIYGVCTFAAVGSLLANNAAYAAGTSGSWMLNSRPLALGITVMACLIAFLFNVRGLHLAKWWSNIGSVLTVATFLVLVALLVRGLAAGLPSLRDSLSLAWPAASIVTLNVFSKMAISALSGFDGSAIFSEECRKPENDVARSVVIAAPLIAVMYILGTGAVLAYIPPAKVDLAAAVPQAIQAGFGFTGWGGALVKMASIGFSISYLATMVVYVGMIARLPMVAGWDGLLPAWWSALSPTYRTPIKAIAAVTVSVLILGALSLWGADNQEAVQVSLGAAFGSYCLTYMLLFSVILFAFRSRERRPGPTLMLAALAAFIVSMCALIFEVVPLGEVANPHIFGLKVAGVICATNALGAFLYWRGTRRLMNMALSTE